MPRFRLCPHLAQSPGPSPLRRRTAGRPARGSAGVPSRCACARTAGHIGCCDSTPGRWASEHHRQTGHAVMRGYEPGESRCCRHEDRRPV